MSEFGRLIYLFISVRNLSLTFHFTSAFCLVSQQSLTGSHTLRSSERITLSLCACSVFTLGLGFQEPVKNLDPVTHVVESMINVEISFLFLPIDSVKMSLTSHAQTKKGTLTD